MRKKYKAGDYIRVIGNNSGISEFDRWIGKIYKIDRIGRHGELEVDLPDCDGMYWLKDEVERYDFQREIMLEIESFL